MGTFFDDASLVMIPSGVKEDKLYSIKPTDGSGDFTFSRGSDIQATRVNASGLIEKAKVNNLLQSNNFGTTWTTSSASVTGGQSGYDGSSDAWLLTATSTSNCRVNQSIGGSGVQSISVYAKANTSNFLAINAIVSGTNTIAYFDLSSGAVGTTGGTPIDADIESVGGGWYRCSLVYNDTNTQMRFLITDGDGSSAVTNGNSIYIQDAQLNHGLIAQDYVETTTTAVVEGLTADLPRLDYSGGASCPSLKLEPQRTNLLPNSEYQDGWSVKSNISLITNSATSPEGVQNATNIYPSATGASFFYESLTYTNATTYVFSVFAKANGKDYLQIATSGASWASNVWCTFDLALVATDNNGFESVGIEDYGNGWYRCYIKEKAVATSLSRLVIGLVGNANAGRLSSVTADGTNGVLVYGAQAELGSYPTSYIPTYGTAAVRAQDQASATGLSSTFNSSEGVLYAELKWTEIALLMYLSLSDGSNSNRVVLYRTATNNVRMLVQVGGVTQASFIVTEDSNEYIKVAAKYKANDFAIWVNGTERGTDASGSTFSANTLNKIGFDAGLTGGFSGSVKQVLVFNSALTDAELAALTTI